MAIAIFFLRFLNSYQDWKKICPKHLSRVLLSWEEKNDILSNEDRVGASCKGRSLLNCKFKYRFTFSWHVWNVAEYLVMVCSSSITWRVHTAQCTLITHCAQGLSHARTSSPQALMDCHRHSPTSTISNLFLHIEHLLLHTLFCTLTQNSRNQFTNLLFLWISVTRKKTIEVVLLHEI